MKTNIQIWSYHAQFLFEWEIFQTEVVQKTKTHILCSVTFFLKSCSLEEMGGACGAYVGGERGAQGSSGETWGKETTEETQT